MLLRWFCVFQIVIVFTTWPIVNVSLVWAGGSMQQWQNFRSMTKAEIIDNIVEHCPLTVSIDVPYDYKLEYNKTLTIHLQIYLFRLVQVDDLRKTLIF